MAHSADVNMYILKMELFFKLLNIGMLQIMSHISRQKKGADQKL